MVPGTNWYQILYHFSRLEWTASNYCCDIPTGLKYSNKGKPFLVERKNRLNSSMWPLLYVWTRWPSGTLQMSPLKVPNIFLLRQKFKIDLVFLITCFSLSIREKSMQTMLQKYIFVIFVTKRCLQSLRIQLLNFTQKKVIKRRLIRDNVYLF